MCDMGSQRNADNVARPLFTKKEYKRGNRMKGLAVIVLFYGVLILIVWGVLAILLSAVFSEVAPTFDITYQIFIIAFIPAIGIALLWGIFSSFTNRG